MHSPYPRNNMMLFMFTGEELIKNDGDLGKRFTLILNKS